MKIHEITEVAYYYLQGKKKKKKKRKNTLAIHFKNINKTKIIELMSYYNAVNHKQIIWAVQHKVLQEVHSKHISPVLVWLVLHYILLNVRPTFLCNI